MVTFMFDDRPIIIIINIRYDSLYFIKLCHISRKIISHYTVIPLVGKKLFCKRINPEIVIKVSNDLAMRGNVKRVSHSSIVSRLHTRRVYKV